jgi:hypothetical protein
VIRMRTARFLLRCGWSLCFALGLSCSALMAQDPSGAATIRGPYAGSEIVITTTPRLAGAIHSLTWNEREFIDSADHGRQLQSASNFDVGQPFVPEVFNPTEAGSVHDGAGPTSTSRLWSLRAEGNRLETLTQMAFWLRPDGRSQGHPARNTTALSNHWLKKTVTIGVDGRPNVIAYDATFVVPEGERHTYGQFEAVTGYMPAEFSAFFRFDRATGKLVTLDPGPGEQPDPVVLATPDGRFAMGIWSPDQPSPGFEQAGYGRFAFPRERVVKWNSVFRVRNPQGIATGRYHFRNRVLIGTREAVEQTLRDLLRAS